MWHGRLLPCQCRQLFQRGCDAVACAIRCCLRGRGLLCCWLAAGGVDFCQVQYESYIVGKDQVVPAASGVSCGYCWLSELCHAVVAGSPNVRVTW